MSTKPLQPVLPAEVDTLADSLTSGEGTTLDSPTNTSSVATGEQPIQVQTMTPDEPVPPPDPNNQIISTQKTAQQSSSTQEVTNIIVSNPANNATIKVEGTLTARQDFTAGSDLLRGDVVAIESDGKVYRSRLSGINTGEDSITSAFGVTDLPTLKINDTVALSGDNTNKIHRIVFDTPTKTITSVTQFSPTSNMGRFSTCKLTDTTALQVGGDSVTTYSVYARVLSNLDSTVTFNTEATIHTGDASNRPQVTGVVRVDDTHAIIIYANIDTLTHYARLLTISGTTVTAGAAQTIVTSTGNVHQHLHSVSRFGNTEYYAFSYSEDTSGGTSLTTKNVIFQYNGSTFTFGTPTQSSPLVGNFTHTYANIDDTRRVCAVAYSSNTRVGVITRSGLTLTYGTYYSMLPTATAISAVTVTKMGRDTILIARNNVNCGYVLARLSGDVITQVGNIYNNFIGGNHNLCVLVSPSLFISVYGSVVSMISLTNNYNSILGITSEDILTGASGGVVLKAYSADAAGLTTAEKYYVGTDGEMVTLAENGEIEVGVALSATEIKINI